ncbi:MAG TPA: polyhydroxyalkanoate depolymerase, partial [Methylomirabilota bacterium]|nr:polyhydroxyalkanoate depolymerase [Methylomirabilota bacterium]
KMKFDWLSFTNAPATNGRSLFISMHGGGGAPKAVNDSQWRNQVQLGKSYQPSEGIYVAPRAPTDAWNLWHQAHIDQFFDRLIENFVVLENVNGNRVYILGYSAGGDGVYQLGPRMADRWAAASMMAGHPNEASPLGLRNVPFAIQVGGNDAAYKRNAVAAEWGKKLDALQKGDPAGYPHFTEIHAGKPHWMGLEDKKAIPWMEQFTRNSLPEKIVWQQDDVTHARFYWLARPNEEVKRGQQIIAERAGQTITLSSPNVQTVTVRFNDQMVNLDREVVIRVNDRELWAERAPRTIATLARTLAERGDTNLTFSAEVTVTLR